MKHKTGRGVLNFDKFNEDIGKQMKLLNFEDSG